MRYFSRSGKFFAKKTVHENSPSSGADRFDSWRTKKSHRRPISWLFRSLEINKKRLKRSFLKRENGAWAVKSAEKCENQLKIKWEFELDSLSWLQFAINSDQELINVDKILRWRCDFRARQEISREKTALLRRFGFRFFKSVTWRWWKSCRVVSV